MFFLANKGSLGVFHGALGVANFFFFSTWHAIYSIPALKLLAIFKSAKLDFVRIFRANKGSWGCSAVPTTLPIFY